MEGNLHAQIDKLKKMLLTQGALVEEAVDRSIDAVRRRDAVLAEQIIADDRQIDWMELQLEEACLNTLALFQPLASDIRFMVSVMKMNNHLERIGDLAVNIAERAESLAGIAPQPTQPIDLSLMARRVRAMLKGSLDALVNMDLAQARQVIETEQQVDQMLRDMFPRLYADLGEFADHAAAYLHCLHICRNLERMGDHAINIIDDVTYMITGISRSAAGRTEPRP
jgi:phosphate transport system protein